MKKSLIILGLAIAGVIHAQQIIPAQQIITNTFVPTVVWTNENAVVIASQLLAITNSDGSLIVPQNFLSQRSSTINIKFNVGTNGLESISAKVVSH